jgi:hypothetical protein
MLRELDERVVEGLRVTLEWESDTGAIVVHCQDEAVRHRSGLRFRVPPQYAWFAFRNPFAVLDPAVAGHPAPRPSRKRWRGWTLHLRRILHPRPTGLKLIGCSLGVAYLVAMVVALINTPANPCRGPAGDARCVGPRRPAAVVHHIRLRPDLTPQIVSHS